MWERLLPRVSFPIGNAPPPAAVTGFPAKSFLRGSLVALCDPLRELACRKPRNGCRRWRVPESRNERVVESRNDCVAKSRKDRVVESRNDRAVKSWIPGPKGVMEPKGVTCGPPMLVPWLALASPIGYC